MPVDGAARPCLGRTARVSRAPASAQMPSARQRSCHVRTVCHGPKSFGRYRHWQPVFCKYRQAFPMSYEGNWVTGGSGGVL